MHQPTSLYAHIQSAQNCKVQPFSYVVQPYFSTTSHQLILGLLVDIHFQNPAFFHPICVVRTRSFHPVHWEISKLSQCDQHAFLLILYSVQLGTSLLIFSNKCQFNRQPTTTDQRNSLGLSLMEMFWGASWIGSRPRSELRGGKFYTTAKMQVT